MPAHLVKADFTDKRFPPDNIAGWMLKVFLLIFRPAWIWDRIAQAQRGAGFITLVQLLPMLIVATAVEGWGLIHWGKWNWRYDYLKHFTESSVLKLELIQAALFFVMILVCCFAISAVGQTFRARRTFLQAYTLMVYGFSPLFLVRMADAFPHVHPIATWLAGIALVVWSLYQGVPRILNTDPTHAFGVYLATAVVVVLMSAIARLLPALYVMGYADFDHSWLSHGLQLDQ